jgi:hypothetical protein
MCRSAGRRCPSSRPASRGGTRTRRATPGQPGDTPQPAPSPPPGPSVVNFANHGATVGVQCTSFAGSVTFTSSGITVTGTPADQPAPAQAGASHAYDARAADAIRRAAGAARESVRSAGDTANVAGGNDVVAVQAGSIRAGERGDTRARRAAQPPAAGRTVIGGSAGSVISGGTFTGPVVMGSAVPSPAGMRGDTGPVVLDDGNGHTTVIGRGIHDNVITGGTFTGPVSFGGHASAADLTVSHDDYSPAQHSTPASRAAGDTASPPDRPGSVTFAGGATFAPGATVAFGAPAAGRRVRYNPADTDN